MRSTVSRIMLDARSLELMVWRDGLLACTTACVAGEGGTLAPSGLCGSVACLACHARRWLITRVAQL